MKFRFLFPLTTLLVLILFSCDNGAVTDAGDSNGTGSDGSLSFNHERNPDVSATEFLIDDDFQNLVLEIQYMEGYAPTSDTISNL